MLRRILFEMGIVNWCKPEGISHHYNEGLSKPSREYNAPREMVCIGNNTFVSEL